jgi:hypothetical protein
VTVGTEQLVTVELLRDFVDGLKARADLDAHPLSKLLATLPQFGRYVGTTDGAGLVGGQVAKELRAIWRQRFMPHVLNAERLVKWNAFFILEVMYFYPYAKGLPYPDTLKDAAVLLCDANHLALIVADGDAEQAQRLIEGHPEFWGRLIPAAMTPAEQTLHSRRKAGLAKLAREVTRLGLEGATLAVERIADASRPAVMPDADDIHSPTDERNQTPPPALTFPSQFVSEVMASPTSTQPAEQLVGLDGLPMSPNARRMYEACGGFLPMRAPYGRDR